MSAKLMPKRSLALVLAAGVWFAACGTPPAPQEFWRPWYDIPKEPTDDPLPDLATDVEDPPDLASGRIDLAAADLAAADLASADLATMPGKCALSVTVTTLTAGGRYSPRNIGAIWVSDDSDHFIKTLAVWADKRAKYLKRWYETTTAAKVPASRVDAISSATKTSHGVRTGTWNCTNFAAMPVADGAYKVCFELTDYDGQGPYNCVSFTKSPTSFSITPADSPSFTARKLELLR